MSVVCSDIQGSISFCHGQSLGIAAGAAAAAGEAGYPKEAAARDEPQKGGDLGDLLFKEAAEQTRHGVLILQLTIGYLRPRAQWLPQNRLRWKWRGQDRKPTCPVPSSRSSLVLGGKRARSNRTFAPRYR